MLWQFIPLHPRNSLLCVDCCNTYKLFSYFRRPVTMHWTVHNCTHIVLQMYLKKSTLLHFTPRNFQLFIILIYLQLTFDNIFESQLTYFHDFTNSNLNFCINRIVWSIFQTFDDGIFLVHPCANDKGKSEFLLVLTVQCSTEPILLLLHQTIYPNRLWNAHEGFLL